MATCNPRAAETFVVWALAVDFSCGTRRDFDRLRDALDWAYSLFDSHPTEHWRKVEREHSVVEVWLDGRELVWRSEDACWARDIPARLPLAVGSYLVEFDEASESCRFSLMGVAQRGQGPEGVTS